MKKLGEWFKKTFIPHEANGLRPSVLRATTIVPVLITIVIIQTVFFFGSSYIIPRSNLFGVVEVNALTDGTNTARVDDHVPALAIDPSLQAAAQKKANDMVANNYFAHTSPDGITPWYWFIDTGYRFSYAGENLAVNFSDSEEVTDAWLNSPEHRANILDPHFTQIGIAIAQGAYKGRMATYVVELFGTPAANEAVSVAAKPRGTLTKADQKVAVTKPVLAAPLVPTVIATSGSANSGSEEMSVAVKGAATQAVPATTTVSPVVSAEQAPVAQTNVIQRAIANPTHAVDYLYLIVLFFFLFALGLNIFIKIRVQHPDLILGGLVAITIAGIFILVNQHYLLGVVIK